MCRYAEAKEKKQSSKATLDKTLKRIEAEAHAEVEMRKKEIAATQTDATKALKKAEKLLEKTRKDVAKKVEEEIAAGLYKLNPVDP